MWPLCRGPEAQFAEGRALGKDFLCRRPTYAEGRALGKGLFVEGPFLPKAPGAGPRQRVPSPSAYDLALGKTSCPR